MKKQFKVLTFILMLTISVFVLCSCGIVVGDNAYDLALKNGFEGTEEEWLESLKGEKGENGKDGANGLNGMNGKDGLNFNAGYTAKDLYDEAVQNGYDKDFLTFIKEVFGSSSSVSLEDGINRGLESSCNIMCYYQDSKGATYQAGGSGVFYNVDKEKGDALIITNYHVVYNKKSTDKRMIYDKIFVYLYGDRFFQLPIEAQYIGGSSLYDIALLRVGGSEQIKNSSIKACEFFDSADLSVGQNVIAIGNPSSDGTSVTRGVISVPTENIDLDESSADNANSRLIRFDAPVNPGNSGGGLFDEKGRVVGIVNAKLVKENYENIGYAIPSNIVKRLIENIARTCDGENVYTIKKALIGLSVESRNSKAVFNESRNRYDIIEEIYVAELTLDSKVKDIFVVDDRLVYAEYKGVRYELIGNYVLGEILLNVEVGDEITVGIIRSGENTTVKIVITDNMMVAVE